MTPHSISILFFCRFMYIIETNLPQGDYRVFQISIGFRLLWWNLLSSFSGTPAVKWLKLFKCHKCRLLFPDVALFSDVEAFLIILSLFSWTQPSSSVSVDCIIRFLLLISWVFPLKKGQRVALRSSWGLWAGCSQKQFILVKVLPSIWLYEKQSFFPADQSLY